MTEKKKVVGYARVSTANQLANIDYTSIDSQIQIIKDYVESRPELELEEIFIDRAKSAKNMNRPAIKDMVRRIKAGGISYVVSYRLDRITREKFSYYEFERILNDFNVKIIYTNDLNTDDTPSGEYVKDIKIASASFERMQSSQRVRDKMYQTLKQGYHVSGLPPIGYLSGRKSKTIVVDKNCAPHIKKIFEDFLLGKKPSQISNEFSDAGVCIPPRKLRCGKVFKAKPYSENIIRKILANPTYAGFVFRRTKGLELFKGRHKAIISEDTWKAAQRKLEENRGKRDCPEIKKRKDYLLKGKLFCTCGAHMTVTWSGNKHKDGSNYYYYTCTRKIHNRSNCGCKTQIAMRILDNVLLSALAYVGSRGLSVKDVESSTETYRESLIKEEAELNCGIKRLKLEIDRALERFGELGDDDILKNSSKEILRKKAQDLKLREERLREVEKELSALHEKFDMGKLQIESALGNYEGILEELTFEEKSKLVEACIKKLVIYCDSTKSIKRNCVLKIYPTEEYAKVLGDFLQIKFNINNSRGLGLWEITSPFKLTCSDWVKANEKKAGPRGRHFIHGAISRLDEMRKNNLSLRKMAKNLDIKHGMLWREKRLLEGLSLEATNFLKRLRYVEDIQKFSFRFLENVANVPARLQLNMLKERLNKRVYPSSKN